MSNGDAIARLRDLHLPDPISWWPIAPAWYALVLCVMLMLVAGFLGRRYYRRGQARREGLKLLMDYEKQAQQGTDMTEICAQIAALLRRVALVYFPRQDIVRLQGDDWILFLSQTGKQTDFMSVRTLLLEKPYQQSSMNNSDSLNELTPLFKLTRNWIKQRRTPCLN